MPIRRYSFRIAGKIAILMFLLVNVIHIYKLLLLESKNVSLYNISFDLKRNNTHSTVSQYWRFKEVCHTVKEYNSPKILETISKINKEERIKNQDKFDSIRHKENTTTIIVIQVHDRINHLRHLISSLGVARGIDQTLLIFSHDFWDEEINLLVDSIRFANVLQIFYPFSIQTHPNVFPGDSPKDCSSKVSTNEARTRKCINAEWPDSYGHYRQAEVTQIKHHWWWKANQVFDHLRLTKSFQGLVLFLEEDHYLADDFLHVLSLMQNQRDLNYSNCDILCLGTHQQYQTLLPSVAKSKSIYQSVGIAPWHNAKHNMGMAFDRRTWNKIKSCAASFCQFDDYNWDWSLLHTSLKCTNNTLNVMYMKAPRVFHIGECGFHKKNWFCNPDDKVREVSKTIEKAGPYLFPKSIIVTIVSNKTIKLPKGNGGWGDKRDHQLCLNMSTSKLPLDNNTS